MADYPLISLLSQVDATIPAGGEAASKLDDSIRQLKSFLKTYLAVAHDDTGALKSGVVAVTTIADGSLTYAKLQNVSATDRLLGRSTAGAGPVEEIVCTPAGRTLLDDVDAAAQRSTLGLGALSVKATVATADLDALAVTTAKLNDLAVTNAKLAASAVDAAKLAANAVDPTKISNIGEAKLLVGDGAATVACTVAGALTAARSGSSLVFSLAAGGSSSGFSAMYALMEERFSSGSNAGASTGGSYVARSLTEVADAGDIIGISGANVTIRMTGTYLIRASAPAYSVGLHRIKLRQTSGTPADLLLGTSASAPIGVTTRSTLTGLLTISDANTVVQLQHWTETTVANGFGIASGAGEQELYAQLEVLKV